MAGGNGRRPPKLSWRQKLAQSEERNIGLVKYVQHLEWVCKQVLLIAAKKHEEYDTIITPEGEKFKPCLADICRLVAPVCQDVEAMKLPAEAIAQLVGDGGKVVKFNQKGGEGRRC